VKSSLSQFRENLSGIPEKVKNTSKGKFSVLLIALFLLPGGSILCLIAVYFRFKNYKIKKNL